MGFDIDKMNKFPAEARFFDLNELWYFSNRWAIRFLYPLPVTANQITFLSLVMGVLAAGFYFSQAANALIWGAGFLYLKIYLDNVDGNLARLRGEVSRLGRFFDSLTDFTVTSLVYAGIATHLVRETGDSAFWVLGGIALLSAFLHCSYFVFYLVSYASIVGTYSANRVDEKITGEDERAGFESGGRHWDLILQRLHVWVYGWQDSAMQHLDRCSRGLAGVGDSGEQRKSWYCDKLFLALSSPLCLCTNNMVLVLFSVLERLDLGLFLIVIVANGYLVALQAWKIGRTRRRVS